MRDNEIKEITASEICETAKMNRSAFYARCADVLARMRVYRAKIEKKVEARPHIDGEFAWIFEYIKSNADVFENYFKLAISEKEADYQFLFFRNGVYAAAKMWFEGGCREPPEQTGEIVKREYTKIRQSSVQIYLRHRLCRSWLPYFSVNCI